jgi:hypothetical protein
MAKIGADVEIEFLNRKISELERAKELVYEARMSASASEPAAEKPKRGRKPRKGLPVGDDAHS